LNLPQHTSETPSAGLHTIGMTIGALIRRFRLEILHQF
jgi:hypothetical protein